MRKLVVLSGICAAIVAGGPVARAQMGGPALVAVSPVVEREITAGQAFVGTVMPLRMAIVGSAVDDRVIAYPHNEGDRVEQGDVLAKLLTDTVQLEWQAAAAELDLRKQELAELENGTRPEEIEQARARMLGAQATMNYNDARRRRAENLYTTSHALSEEERDEAISAAIAADQSYLEAKEAYQLAVEGPRAEVIAQARAQVAMQQAAADRLKDLVDKHTITSPFAGYVTAEHTEVGQWVKQGDPIAEVAALDEVEVTTYVVEQHVPFVHVGAAVWVDIPAIPDRVFAGTVTAIVPQADLQARTFPVKVRVKNEIDQGVPLLKSGMYARVMLPTGRRQQALLVPKDALVLGGPQKIVYVVQLATGESPGRPAAPNAQPGPGKPAAAERTAAPHAAPQIGVGSQGSAQPVPVQLGTAAGDLIQVIGQLQPGQMVVVAGNERLQPGQAIQVQSIVPPPAPADDSPSQANHPEPPVEKGDRHADRYQ